MDDKDFERLKRLIEHKSDELHALQKMYKTETGRDYVFGGGVVASVVNINIARKNKLLERALEQLLACEWEVPLSVIVAIEKELSLCLRIRDNLS